MHEVTTKLIELGIQPNAGSRLVAQGDVKMQEDAQLKRFREAATNLLGNEKGNKLAELIGSLGINAAQAAPPVPSWAEKLEDKRSALMWDKSQYIGNVGINGKLTCCIVDTGAHRTVIDTKMAEILGLKVNTTAQCGKFSVPGSDAVHSYAGIVEG